MLLNATSGWNKMRVHPEGCLDCMPVEVEGQIQGLNICLLAAGCAQGSRMSRVCARPRERIRFNTAGISCS